MIPMIIEIDENQIPVQSNDPIRSSKDRQHTPSDIPTFCPLYESGHHNISHQYHNPKNESNHCGCQNHDNDDEAGSSRSPTVIDNSRSMPVVIEAPQSPSLLSRSFKSTHQSNHIDKGLIKERFGHVVRSGSSIWRKHKLSHHVKLARTSSSVLPTTSLENRTSNQQFDSDNRHPHHLIDRQVKLPNSNPRSNSFSITQLDEYQEKKSLKENADPRKDDDNSGIELMCGERGNRHEEIDNGSGEQLNAKSETSRNSENEERDGVRLTCLSSLKKLLKWKTMKPSIRHCSAYKQQSGTMKGMCVKEGLNSPIKRIQRKGLGCYHESYRQWSLRRALGRKNVAVLLEEKRTRLRKRKLELDIPLSLSSNIPESNASEEALLTFAAVPNLRCEGELRLRKVRSLTGASHCQFFVWEMEVIGNTLTEVMGSAHVEMGRRMSSDENKRMMEETGKDIENNDDNKKTCLVTEKRKKIEHRRLWWNVPPGFRLAVKFHIVDSVKPQSTSEKYRRTAILKEGRNLEELSKIWKECVGDDEVKNVELGERENTPWKDGHNCPVPQYYWTLCGQLLHSQGSRHYHQHVKVSFNGSNTSTDNPSCLDVVAVGMELIKGIPFTAVVRDVRLQGVTTVSRARLLVDIARRTVRSQRFVAGQLPFQTREGNLQSSYKMVNGHRSYSLINWDTKPGNVMLSIGETFGCFARDVGMDNCPMKHVGGTKDPNDKQGERSCSCPPRLLCHRAVIIDIGDALPGPQFIFPALGPSRKGRKNVTRMGSGASNEALQINEKTTEKENDPRRVIYADSASRQDEATEVHEEMVKRDAAKGPDGFAWTKWYDGNSEQRQNLSMVTRRLEDMAKRSEGKDIPANQRFDGISTIEKSDQRPKLSENESRSVVTTESSSSRPSSHLQASTPETQNSSISQMMSQMGCRTDPSSHVVCTAGFCSPECAILVFLLASATRHVAFRQLWYSNAADINQMIYARNARRKWIWQKWLAEESIVIVDTDFSSTPRGSSAYSKNPQASSRDCGQKLESNSDRKTSMDTMDLRTDTSATPIQRKLNNGNDQINGRPTFQEITRESADSDSILNVTTTTSSFLGRNERWGIRFTERTVVFSLGLIFAHLWSGKGLLSIAEKDPVYVIDALCEWEDEWPRKAEHSCDGKNHLEDCQPSALSSTAPPCETSDRSLNYKSKPTVYDIQFCEDPHNSSEREADELQGQSVNELNVCAFGLPEKDTDGIGLDKDGFEKPATLTMNGRHLKTVKKDLSSVKKRSTFMRRFGTPSKLGISPASLLASFTPKGNRQLYNHRFGSTFPADQSHKDRCRGRSAFDVNFYSGKKRLGVESVFPTNGIFSEASIGERAKKVLAGCLRFVPGDRLTLEQLEDELNELYCLAVTTELNESCI